MLTSTVVMVLFRHSLAVRKRRELRTTEIEDALIANAANIGLMSIPMTG